MTEPRPGFSSPGSCSLIPQTVPCVWSLPQKQPKLQQHFPAQLTWFGAFPPFHESQLSQQRVTSQPFNPTPRKFPQASQGLDFGRDFHGGRKELLPWNKSWTRQDNSVPKAAVAVHGCRSQSGSQWDPPLPKSATSIPPTLLSSPQDHLDGVPFPPHIPSPQSASQNPRQEPGATGKAQNSFGLLPYKNSCWDGR